MKPGHEGYLTAAEQRLLPLYSEPHRAYHNVAHVRALLKLADTHADLIRDPLAVKLAIWFHDAVYDTALPDNEQRSASMAQQTLSEWHGDPGLISSVVSKVSATAGHSCEDGDTDTALFLDFDLSVLAAPEAVYDLYANQIAQEYSWVPPLAYRNGRIDVLQGFLRRPHLYFTERFRAQWEVRALDNLRRELKSLTDEPGAR